MAILVPMQALRDIRQRSRELNTELLVSLSKTFYRCGNALPYGENSIFIDVLHPPIETLVARC